MGNPVVKFDTAHMGLIAGTTNSYYVTWTLPSAYKSKWSSCDKFEVEWWVYYGQGVPFLKESTSVEYRKSITKFTSRTDLEDNVSSWYVRVKPVATKKGKWTGAWNKTKKQNIDPSKIPEVPTISETKIEANNGFGLIVKSQVYDKNTTHIRFRIIVNNGLSWKNDLTTGWLAPTLNEVAFSMGVLPGRTYRVQAQARNLAKGTISEWSEYSGDVVSGAGEIPRDTLTVRVLSATSVELHWGKAPGANEYEVEWVNNPDDFEKSPSRSSQTHDNTVLVIAGLEAGRDYYFRVRGRNNEAGSDEWSYGEWSEIIHTTVGKEPGPPTTWSSSTTVIATDDVNLYWIHNTADGSKQVMAEIELEWDGGKVVFNPDVQQPEEDQEEKTYVYTIPGGRFSNGATVTWRVRTQGITGVYGQWSTTREIKFYAQPRVRLSVDGFETDEYYNNILTHYPLTINATATPDNQTALSFDMQIIALDNYDLYDDTGSRRRVNAGDIVMQKFYQPTFNEIEILLTPEDAILENTQSYRLVVSAHMDSGLSAEEHMDFEVLYDIDEDYNLEAYIVVDKETATCQIKPGCYRLSDDSVYPNVNLSILRREYDGTLTKIIDGLNNEDQSYIMDPHPALDYARYRVVARFMDTGRIDFFDASDEEVGITDIVINWDEEIETLITDSTDDQLEDGSMIGNMIRLPYNIDVSDTMKPDVELVDYIGRSHSVAYYNTKSNHNSKWDVMVEKEDSETIKILRTLGNYKSDVYVREPSGTGYWATIELNVTQRHNEPAVPVSITITRVEGGV